MRSDTEKAYLAGLIDGEGSIQARYRPGQHGGYDYSLTIANTDEAMIRWVEQRWGGRVYTYAPRSPRHRQQWTWRVHSNATVSALEDALPYLVTKREHAEVVLSLARSKRQTGRGGYTDQEHVERQGYVDRLTELNRRGAA